MQSTKKIIREFHADGADREDQFTLVGGATLTHATRAGMVGDSTTLAGSWFHMGDRLVFDIDDLVAVEFIARIDDFVDAAVAYLGVATAYNATPDSVAQKCWFEIGGAAVGGERPIKVRADDGSSNDTTITTSFTTPEDDWKRYRLDFKTGVVSRGAPLSSLGGKESIRYSVTDSSLGYQRNEELSSNLNMSAYSAGLQLYFGLVNAGTDGCILEVKSACVEYNDVM